MNRATWINYINEKLTVLRVRIEARGKQNILDLHIYSENFYRDFLNILYGWKLRNANSVEQNIEAIDLIDDDNKLVIQVSATATKQKIDKSLEKDSIESYSKKGYTFKFMSISKPAESLRSMNFSNPHNITFNASSDIFDIESIEKDIMDLEIDELESVYQFIYKELGVVPDVILLDSDLTAIINILGNVDLTETMTPANINTFEIDKKIKFNHIEITSSLISDYVVYYNKVDMKYKEFDKLGANKSIGVFNTLKRIYINAKLKKKYNSDDELLLGIIEEVKQIIINSHNFIVTTKEQLDLCVSIIVVDAFIRCKIFENPEGYNYVIT